PGTPDGPAAAFVRPHDIVLARPLDAAPSEDAVLPGTAAVRFISALGQRAAVELLYERKLIEVESSREKLNELGLRVGDRCAIRLGRPRIYAKPEAEASGPEHPPRLRLRRRPRAA